MKAVGVAAILVVAWAAALWHQLRRIASRRRRLDIGSEHEPNGRGSPDGSS
ncbi:MAG: hypothetical protein ABIV94_10705 [Acidimicrobiales bacterium]